MLPDCASGSEPAKARAVTRTKEFKEQLAFLVEEGTRARIEKVRGDASQADFLRAAVNAAISKAKRKPR